MSYQTLKIKENNDVEKLNEYPNNSLIFRIGYRSNMYSYFTEKDKKIIINYIKYGIPKYEVFLKNDLTKFYMDCEAIIPEYNENILLNFYKELNINLINFLNANGFNNNFKIIYKNKKLLLHKNK